MYLKPFFAMILFSSAACAETWYYDAATAKSGNVKDPYVNPTVWTNSLGTTATELTSSDELVVSYGLECEVSARKLACEIAKVHIGAADGSYDARIAHTSGGVSGLNLYWHNGTFCSSGWRASWIQDMAVFVDGTENGTKHLWCYYKRQNSSTYNMAWGVSGPFTGDANQTVTLKLVEKGCTSDPENCIQQFPFSGNSVSWLGKFEVSDCANFVLGHANAAGSPSAPRADAIVLGPYARFAVRTGVTPNSARGITITGEGVRFLAQEFPWGLTDCTDYTLDMPICGEYGFSKTGPGRVAIGGAYTAGAITVEEGTLEILADATVSAGTEITVKSGATLVSHQSLSHLSVNGEEGSTVRRIVDPVVVPFDNAAVSASVAVIPGDTLSLTNVIRFSLSEAIAIPRHESLEFRIMTYSGDGTLSADMIRDVTDKPFGLPKTSFRIVAEDGVQSVWLKTEPVVVSVADIPYEQGVNINGTAETWSDGQPAHAGADYVLTNAYQSYNGSSKSAFNGDSLTLSGATYSSAASDNLLVLSNGDPVTVWPPFNLIQGYSGGRYHDIRGKICIEGTYGDEPAFKFESTYNDPNRVSDGNTRGAACLSADLTGAGTLKLSGGRKLSLSGLTGDNSGFRGRIIMNSGVKGDTLSGGMRVRVNGAGNFGGAPDEFRYDAVTLVQKAFLYPVNDVSLVTDVNRGLYVQDAGVECAEGMTFTCAWPIRLDGTFSKIGPGTLRIAGPISYGADGTGETGVMEVREGALSVLDDDAVAGLSVVFSNGTSFAVGYGLATGLTVAPSVLTADGSAGTVSLAIDEDSLPAAPPEGVSVVVATLPSRSDDIRGLFTLPRRVSRYTAFRLEKTASESGSHDVYELKASITGFSISIR